MGSGSEPPNQYQYREDRSRRSRPPRPTGRGPSALLTIVGCSIAATVLAGSGHQPRTFRLQPEPDGFALTVHVGLRRRAVTFSKEPDFGGRDIMRGYVPTASSRRRVVRYHAWDRSERKLYVDLNGNLDLTDDPSGVYQCKARGPWQTFEGIHITDLRDGVPVEYTFDMGFYTEETCWVKVRSGWEGDIELGSKRHHLRIADNMDGAFDRKDLFIFTGEEDGTLPGCPDADTLNAVPGSLFIDGRHYDLTFAFEAGKAQTELAMTVTESRPVTGTLEIEGKHIQRLILHRTRTTGGPGIAILDVPGATVMVPAGQYAAPLVFLDGGSSGGPLRAWGNDRVAIEPNGTTALKIGAPLSNTVRIVRKGDSVNIAYKLLGVGGEQYTSLQRAERSAPTFTIYKGLKRIASRSFEYG